MTRHGQAVAAETLSRARVEKKPWKEKICGLPTLMANRKSHPYFIVPSLPIFLLKFKLPGLTPQKNIGA